MNRKNISSGSPFESKIGFSRAVRVGNLISVSGTAPIAPDGKTSGIGDAYLQTKRCFEIIEQALKLAGAELKNVVRTRTYLTDASDWEQVAKAHGEIFGNIRPASTMVVVKGFLNPEWLVEIEVDAILE